MKDPNEGHALTFGKLCKCGAELCHPEEIKSGECYPCKAKHKDVCACGKPSGAFICTACEEFFMGNEAYAKDHCGP